MSGHFTCQVHKLLSNPWRMWSHLDYTAASEKSAWTCSTQESRVDMSPPTVPPVPPDTLHWAKGWEQVVLQFPFRVQGSAGCTLGEEENALTCGTGEKLGDMKNKSQKARARMAQGEGSRSLNVMQNKLEVQPHFCNSLLPGWQAGFKGSIMLPVIHLKEHHLLPCVPLSAVEKLW